MRNVVDSLIQTISINQLNIHQEYTTVRYKLTMAGVMFSGGWLSPTGDVSVSMQLRGLVYIPEYSGKELLGPGGII